MKLHLTAHLETETGIEGVAKRPPHAFRLLDRTALQLETVAVRSAVHQAQITVGGIADRVRPPAAQPPVGQFRPYLTPAFAVLARDVAGGEIEHVRHPALFIARPEQFVPRRIEQAFGRIARRQAFKPVLPASDRSNGRRRRDSQRTMAPPQSSIRINEPPFSADFLDTEMSGGLQLRPLQPSAPLVPVRRSGIGCEIFLFGRLRQRKIGIGLHLSGPVAMNELSVTVDERKESVNPKLRPGDDSFRASRTAAGENATHLRRIELLGIVHPDRHLHHILQIYHVTHHAPTTLGGVEGHILRFMIPHLLRQRPVTHRHETLFNKTPVTKIRRQTHDLVLHAVARNGEPRRIHSPTELEVAAGIEQLERIGIVVGFSILEHGDNFITP